MMNAKYKELFDIALSLQKENKTDDAIDIYNTLLGINPDDYNVLNLLGMAYMTKNNYEESIVYLSKAVVLNNCSYFLSNLAKAYFLNKQYNDSISLYLKALEMEETDDICYSLGLAYKTIKSNDNALKYYHRAIELNPNLYNAYYNIAVLYKEMNNSAIAVDFCLKAKEISTDDVDLFTMLSSLYENLGDFANAAKALEDAVKLKSDNYLFYFNLGVLYSKLGNIQSSLKNYLKVLEIVPDDFETHINLANIYRETDKNTALSYALKAFDINNKEVKSHLLLAQIYRELYLYENSLNILNDYLVKDTKNSEIYYQIALNNMDLGEYSLALENYQKALSIQPDNLLYLKGKAIALKYLGCEDEAVKLLEFIYENDNQSNSTAVSLGMCYLKNKIFDKGMELYSKRSFDTKFYKLFSEKIWDRSQDISGKNVLLYSDCGLGDTIMFARYLPLLKQKVNSLILQTDIEIVDLLKNSFPDINIISKLDERPDYDVVIPMMSISYALGMNFDSIPNSNGYLAADDAKIKQFKELDIFKNSNLKVGICYQGNKRVLKNRSIDFSKLKDIFSVQNVDFYSFQLDCNDENGVISLKDYIKDYSDTAALLNCIDVLISIDSSIVHVAGSLNIKTLLLLPQTAEWRWFDDTVSTPWYDSVKIFKQTSSSDWSQVLKDVKSELMSYGD